MLIQYTVKNFLSFKDQVTLSMVASKRKSKDPLLDMGAVWPLTDDMQLLKCAVIYGANNSGKSNIIKSLLFLKQFILDSSKESRANDRIKVSSFSLNPETEKSPSSFEIIFSKNRYMYQYELSVSQNQVEIEKLSRRALKKSASTIQLFSRDQGNISINNKAFKEGKGLESRTRSNALFLSVCANFDGPISSEVTEWFSRIGIISGLNDANPLAWTSNRLNDPEIGEYIQQLLRVFDLGIDRFEAGEEIPGFRIENIEHAATNSAEMPTQENMAAVTAALAALRRKPSRKIISYHKMYTEKGEYVRDVPFDLIANESAGTKKLVALAGPIIDTLRSASLMIIDEFDSRLHANITGTILKVFNSTNTNPNGAQLIAATHDTNLLSGDHLRRDQVWFTGRDSLGHTSLTSLVEYRVRNDASFERNYLSGDYGGIPFLRPELFNIYSKPKNKPSE